MVMAAHTKIGVDAGTQTCQKASNLLDSAVVQSRFTLHASRLHPDISQMKKPTPTLSRILVLGSLMGLVILALAACGSPEPTTVAPAPPPTWTPTPYVEPTPVPPSPTPAPPAAEVAVAAPAEAPAEAPPATDTPVPEPTEEPTPEPPPTATPIPAPRLVVTNATANVRKGPGTAYNRVGTVSQGETFDITGKNKAGNWWQFQLNGQPVWIFGDLVRAENADTVVVAQNIPAPPVRPTQPPPPPTNTPVPSAPDPCAGIPGDGCKWKVRGGPAFTPNGGGELKLTLAFIHSGRGDEAQGSYFVWLEKDGVKLPIPDSVRSWPGGKRDGPHGPYNYEYKIGIGDLPGNSVAGCYVGWVLDGNGERDSQNFQFCVPDGQGEVWIKFDQA